MPEVSNVLGTFCEMAGLSTGELWLRYFELGGMSTAYELQAVLWGEVAPSARDHDTIAIALNERFGELGREHLVPYEIDVAAC